MRGAGVFYQSCGLISKQKLKGDWCWDEFERDVAIKDENYIQSLLTFTELTLYTFNINCSDNACQN